MSDFIHSPFSPESVQRLNEWQTGTHAGIPVHPFTCANRGDGHHGEEGGDLGVLIATADGWVCPHCDYTQDWAHAMMVQSQVEIAELLGDAARIFLEQKAESLQEKLNAYRRLAQTGKAGAQVMVECLERRRSEILANSGSSHVSV